MATRSKFKFCCYGITFLLRVNQLSCPNLGSDFMLRQKAGNASNCQEIATIFKNGSFVVEELSSLAVFCIFYNKREEFLLQKNVQSPMYRLGPVF